MTTSKPPLALVSGPNATIPPPRPLGPAGSALWARIQAEYSIQDSGGIELLTLACQCLDRAESLSAAITAEGETVATKSGIRSHPSLRDELQNRALVGRLLTKLGITDMPVKSVGRPASTSGWTPSA